MNCLVKKDGSEGTGRVLMEERGGKKKEEKNNRVDTLLVERMGEKGF